MASLEYVKNDVIVTFTARCNQEDLSRFMSIKVFPNWPEPDRRLSLAKADLEKLKTWFIEEFPERSDVKARYPKPLPLSSSFTTLAMQQLVSEFDLQILQINQSRTNYKYEVANSGSTSNVVDLKISPIGSGACVFNYHLEIV